MLSCDEQEVVHKSSQFREGGKSKNKDFSKLKQVRRTVIRNGKPTEMTFYEDPNKGKKVLLRVPRNKEMLKF